MALSDNTKINYYEKECNADILYARLYLIAFSLIFTPSFYIFDFFYFGYHSTQPFYIITSIYAIILFFNKKKLFIKYFIVYTLLTCIISTYLFLYGDTILQFTRQSLILYLFTIYLRATIILSYIKFSKRVRKTFIN